jgi:hypothetical protein
MIFIHPVQLFALATIFSPNIWVSPPRPPDAPPRSEITTVTHYKVIGGLALSQLFWFIPYGNGCARDSILHGHDGFLGLTPLALRPSRGTTTRSHKLPMPISRTFTSSLLKTTCPVVIIPPRPAPTCHNTKVHPTFEWAAQSPATVPSLVIAQHTCSLSSFHGDERTHVHPPIPPYPLPRSAGVAPISRLLLILMWLAFSTLLGYDLILVRAALVIPTKLMVRVMVFDGTIRGRVDALKVFISPYPSSIDIYSSILFIDVDVATYAKGYWRGDSQARRRCGLLGICIITTGLWPYRTYPNQSSINILTIVTLIDLGLSQRHHGQVQCRSMAFFHTTVVNAGRYLCCM